MCRNIVNSGVRNASPGPNITAGRINLAEGKHRVLRPLPYRGYGCNERPTARPRRFPEIWTSVFHTCPARKHRDAPGGFHVDRLKCALFVFGIEVAVEHVRSVGARNDR